MTTAASTRLVAVKLSRVGRVQAFLAPNHGGGASPEVGDSAVVQTDSGLSVGTVVRTARQLIERRRPPDDSSQRVLRRATRDDAVTRLKQEQREDEALRIATMKVSEHGLGMKLARVDQAFDGSKLTFYFTAEGRVDFRELVKELASAFRTRIEMRQIGVRDEAKMLGGYGTCGRPLCCTTFLTSFEPISIKMAKQQDLSLNPSKLSGLCGRLKCCLRYELPNGKDALHAGCGSEGWRADPDGCACGGCGSKGRCRCRRRPGPGAPASP